MPIPFLPRPIAAAVALCAAAPLATAQGNTVDERRIEEVFIFADVDAVRALPGSGARIGTEQISIEFANDVNQLLKTVPGTYIREEDGYGLRPNIGIRGATSERSSKITLMEDGIMMAPAPYSNPAAYYFPTALRAHSIEVLKGAPLLRYGPQTTGGVVNIVSTPIPDDFGGNVELRAGENGEGDLLANVGGRYGDFGFLLETAQRRSDGFKDVDRGGDSGYEIEDYVAKLSWEKGRHSLLAKAQYSHEVSDETYLGLTDRDFARAPNRRYGLSALDQMRTYHAGFSLRYGFEWNDDLRMTATASRNEFKRDWFRLQDGVLIVNAANSGDRAAQRVLDGTADAFNLLYRANDREFTSQGIEFNVDQTIAKHSLAYGIRLHEDDMDRLQPGAIYDQIDGELVFIEDVDPSGSNNRLEDAEALSAWITDSWQLMEKLNLNLALRYEDVETSRRQFDRADRSDAPLRRSNSSSEWLPGVSLTYDINDDWQLIAGVHRGFSTLGGGAQEFEDPETSVNWEAGFRFSNDWFIEAIAFYSDFDNKTENCSNANPCSNGQVTGTFTTGEAIIQGIELQVSKVWSLWDFTIPVDIAYTYTDASISEDNPSEGFADGDLLAAVPEHSYSARIGLESAIDWDNYLVIKYIDETCVRIGCNDDGDRFNRTDDLIVTDFISRYALRDDAVLFVKVENIFDEQDIISRQPDGARPNTPRTASLGVQYAF
ncbi:MAG: TonB-dependent receptor [Pseudomonadota bacterium]